MDRRIKKAIQIMLHDTQQRVQIRELAQQVNLSPGRFSKLFKVETCLTPKQFVRYWRLRQARELLDQSFLKVNEVAATVGFRHLSSFTREFKNLYGYPPSVSRFMAEQAAKHGFTITRPYGMGYIPEFGVYTYDVRTSVDVRAHGWDTGVWIDGDTGELRKVFLQYGQHTGNTISTVLWGLHYGDIRDILAYRLLVFIFGFVTVILSITGVYVWWKKRKARVLAASRVGLPSAPPASLGSAARGGR